MLANIPPMYVMNAGLPELKRYLFEPNPKESMSRGQYFCLSRGRPGLIPSQGELVVFCCRTTHVKVSGVSRGHKRSSELTSAQA